MTTKTNLNANIPDLSAAIGQSAANKLLDSIKFPFTLFEANTPPPGNLYTRGETPHNEVVLDSSRVKELLKAIAQSAKSTLKHPDDFNPEEKFYSEALANASEIIESAKNCLRAIDPTPVPTQQGQIISFPEKAYLEAIVNGGVESLLDTAKGLELKAVCTHLEVIANNKPGIGLNGPVVSISNSKITGKATAELWAHVPSIRCSRWCTRWTVSWKWVRWASVSVSLTVDLDGYVKVIVNGKVLNAKLHINRLRLDYPILREIPLEGIANRALENKLIPVFDASSFVACVPMINSRFAIDTIRLPNTTGSIEIEIDVKQV